MIEISELEIPDIVLDYLTPISESSPAGIDASNQEEYFILNMEIQKNTPDYKKCIELSSTILKEKSKDIKIAAWLCFAYFRVEKIKGLLDGLKIIYHFLRIYGNDLFPSNPVYRSKSIQFLNTPRFFKLVERENPTLSNCNIFIESEAVLNGIDEECKKKFAENPPVLKAIIEVIKSQAETSNELLNSQKEKANKPIEQIQPEKKIEAAEKPVSQTTNQPKVEDKTIPKPVAVNEPIIQPVKIISEKDGVIQLRKILTNFFEYQDNGELKVRIPESYIIFGISRQLQWGKLFQPNAIESVTQIEAPNPTIQANIKKWYETSDWEMLIPRIEINFLKADSVFQYWLDAQRYVNEALNQKGGNYILASEEIKKQLAQLLKRIPELTKLKFKDRLTPFADDETIKWIYDEVLSSFINQEQKEQFILPPIMGEDYDPINYEYKQACSQLPANVEVNITAMQKSIDIDDRRKGKFLRRLNLSNYCMQAKLFEVAKVHLSELNKFIDEYNLPVWEPALCTAVWQSTYLANKELLSSIRDKEIKATLEREQKDLFNKVAKYDSIIAIKLKQKK